jgi:hypothetical protein
MDISLDYLSIAKRRGIEVAFAKIEELPYKADFFDAIVVCDVLEHVFDLNYCCEKILSCLRPGGVFIVRVPFKENLDVYLKENLPYEFIHLRNFDEASLRLNFQKIFGLQFLEASPTTPYLQGTPRLKLRLLPEDTRTKLAQIAADRPEFIPVASSIEVSEETFQAWIYDLKENSTTLFKEIAGDLIFGIEINAAFIKPYSEEKSRRALRWGTIEAPPNQQVSQDHAFAILGSDFLKFRHEANDELIKTNRALVRVSEQLENVLQSMSAIDQSVSAIDQRVSEQLDNVLQSISALSVPLHKKLIRKLRYILGFSL